MVCFPICNESITKRITHETSGQRFGVVRLDNGLWLKRIVRGLGVLACHSRPCESVSGKEHTFTTIAVTVTTFTKYDGATV